MRIRVSIGGEVREEREIDREVVIGRSSDADLRIRDDQISGRHLAVRPAGDGLEVEDLHSTNGTLLDGKERLVPGRPVPFLRGQKVTLGAALLEVVGAAEGSSTGGITHGATLRAGTMDGHSDLVAIARFQAAAPRLVIAAEHDRRSVELHEMEVTVGRDRKACQVAIDHQSVSSQHAALRYSSTGFELRDLGSANGTFVGDAAVTDWTPVSPPAAVRIGAVDCLLATAAPAGREASDRAEAMVAHIVAQGRATRHEGTAVLEEHRRTGRGPGELLVARGLLAPAEWVAFHAEREAIVAMSRHSLAAPRRRAFSWTWLLVAALLLGAAGLVLALR